MGNLKFFSNKDFGEIRALLRNGEPWFVGKDIAECLGYSNTKDAISKHIDEEDKKIIQRSQIATFEILQKGQIATLEIPNRGLVVVNESGLYSLILSSKLPRAKKFKHWVTTEVLPSIRKHGAYMTDNTIEKALTNPDFLIKLATNLKEEKQKRFEAEKQLEIEKPKVIFAESVQVSQTSILVGDLAKIMKQNGHDIGGKRLFIWLRDNGYLIKRKGTDYNMPTQKAMELKLFEIKETSISHSDGHISISKTPKVTGKGQIYFVNKFKDIKEDM